MSQPLLYDEIQTGHGHRHLHMKNLEEILNTPDDSDFALILFFS